jgi:putative ABC transport system permease protein
MTLAAGRGMLDVRIAVRRLFARPLFAVVIVATLATGIGATAAIFAIIDAVFLRPLPYPRSHQLVALYTRYLPATGYDFPYFPASGPELADLQSRRDAFASVAGYQLTFRNVSFGAGDAERLLTMAVTPEFFDVMEVAAAQGRVATREDLHKSCTVVLRHDFWQQQVARQGRDVRLRLDDAPCDVIGVMPPGFAFRDERIRLWTVLATDASEAPGNRASHGLQVVARLHPDVTPERADEQLQALRREWSERFPDHYADGHFAVLRTLRDDLVGDQRLTLLLMGGAVVFVLLITCANVAGLLVTRSEGRRREFAVCCALGASRGRLIRQAFCETAVIALASGVAGLVIANWVLAGLLTLYPERLPTGDAITIDYRTAFFALLIVGLSAILLGVLPALHASGVRLQESLKTDGRTIVSASGVFASRSLLVAAQMALSVMLVVAALLLIRTYRQLQTVDLGFTARGLLTFFVAVPPGRESDSAAARRLLERIEERLRTVPGVDGVGAISGLPLVSPGPVDDFIIDGRAEPAAGAPGWSARYMLATPAAFETLGVPLKRGRLLSASDAAGRPLVAVVNETAARLYWPGDDPVGTTIRYFPRQSSPPIRIVGVVGDVRSLSIAQPAPPSIYVPLAQSPRPAYQGRGMAFAVRTGGDPQSLIASVRAAVAVVAPGLPLANVREMDNIVAESLGQPRFANVVMSFFASVAVFLAALGLYGVLAYNVEQRARELGIRVALGATGGDVLGLVIGRGLAVAAIGVMVGFPAAAALSRLIQSLLYGVSPVDPLTYLGVLGVLCVATLAASYLPARRALRVDPVVVLRAE